MPLSATLIGQSTAPVEHEVDARWLMAYAAGLGDCRRPFMDTAAGRITAHPVFPVCLEWPANLSLAALDGYASATPEERARGVHASHDLHLFRAIEPGQSLTTVATVVDLVEVSVGALQTTRFDTKNARGEPVAQTWQQGLYRGVAVEGQELPVASAPESPVVSRQRRGDTCGRRLSAQIEVPAGAAHVYTECARIFNPIHTDRAVALAAGLPDIILHGTATLALAVSTLVTSLLDGDASGVRRLGCRFSGMVLVPDSLRLEATLADDGTALFTVTNARGEVAIKDGFLCFGGLRHD